MILLFVFFIIGILALLFSTIQLLHKEHVINNLNDATEYKIQNHKVIIQEYENNKVKLDAITREKNKEQNELNRILDEQKKAKENTLAQKKEYESLDGKNKILDAKIESTKKIQTELDETIASLNKANRKKADEISSKKKEISGLKQEIEALKDKVSPYNDALGAMILSMTSKREKIDKQSAQLDEFNNTYFNIIEDIQVIKKSLNKFEAVIEDETRIFKQNNQDQKNELLVIKNVSDKIKEQSDDIEKIKINLKDVKNNSEIVKQLLKEINDIKNILDKNVISSSKSLDSDINSFIQDLDEAKGLVDREARREIGYEIKELNNQIKKLRETINKKQKEMENR